MQAPNLSDSKESKEEDEVQKVVLKPQGFRVGKKVQPRQVQLGPGIQDLETKVEAAPQSRQPVVAKIGLFQKKKEEPSAPRPVVPVVKPTATQPTAPPTAPQPTAPPTIAQPTTVQPTATQPTESEPVAEPTAAQPLAQPTAAQPLAQPPLAQPLTATQTKVRRLQRPATTRKNTTPDPLSIKIKDGEMRIKSEEEKNPYMKTTTPEGPVNALASIPIAPSNRKSFSRFITTKYRDYELPPLLKNKKINPNACNDLKLQTYKYQAFIREYIRQVNPYRGVLVYHGLGSGKTCTAIAAAEALYGQGKKKIIIMTPISLRDNFLNEIMFCGFRHFRLKNVWVPFRLDGSNTDANLLFLREVLGVSDSYVLSVLKKPVEQRVFWMPDLEQPENNSNFDSLEDWQRTSIRNQLYSILDTRYIFIGYNGYSHDSLKTMYQETRYFFDNAVIIIDEIHNLTRLMRGKLDKYLRVKKDAKKIPESYEPMTIEQWNPKLFQEEERMRITDPEYVSKKRYDRAILFYRLLVEAKDSKIIALSGTPIVNFPEEIGILANILHGDFHCCEDIVSSVQEKDKVALEKILSNHPYVDFFEIKKGQGTMRVFFTALPEKYKKVFEGNALQGVMRDEDYDEEFNITGIYEQIKTKCRENSIPIKGTPVYTSLPLFPPTIDEFREIFVDASNLQLKNKILFMKRMSGLISYYKGSKEELMPQVIGDSVVDCPFSEYALPSYAEARKRERKEEESASKKGPLGEIEGLAGDESTSTSYRFRSRAMCNFVFPEAIPRPFPITKKDFENAGKVDDIVIGDAEVELIKEGTATEGTATEGITNEESEQMEEEPLDAEQVEMAKQEDAAALAKAKEEAAIEQLKSDILNPDTPYEQRIQLAIEALKATSSVNLVSPNLEKYSGKFVKILANITASRGSSLVYSTFRTLEGIGIFSIVLEANGFSQISFKGSENDLELSDETKRSILEQPEQFRYIIYSGGESKRVRQTLIDLFNMRLDKLPTKIAEVLKTANPSILESGNKKGELCRVFMITGAGAEGLSLKNVRTVHIMEPYWNKVRTDQVKGRAIRICSHSTLPYDEDPSRNERTVEIFTYLSTIPQNLIDTKKVDVTLSIQDEGKTSDQHVYDLSTIKDKVSEDFIKSMKEGAIDCVLNQSENGDIKCYVQEGTVDDFLFDPRIEEDISKTPQESRLEPSTGTGTAAGTTGTAAGTAGTAGTAVERVFTVETGKSGTQYIMEKRGDLTLIFKYSDFGKLRDPKLYDTVKPIQTIAKKKK